MEPISKGREEKGGEGKGREREGQGRVGPQLGSLDPPVLGVDKSIMRKVAHIATFVLHTRTSTRPNNSWDINITACSFQKLALNQKFCTFLRICNYNATHIQGGPKSHHSGKLVKFLCHLFSLNMEENIFLRLNRIAYLAQLFNNIFKMKKKTSVCTTV